MSKARPAPRCKGDAARLRGPRPFFLVSQIRLALVQRLDRELRPLGITPALSVALNAVSYARQTSSAQLAQLLGITPQSVKQTVMALERRGLVRRAVSARDHRILVLTVTRKGLALQRRAFAAVARIYRDVFADLSPAELRTLQNLLIKVLRAARPEALARYRDVRRTLDRST